MPIATTNVTAQNDGDEAAVLDAPRQRALRVPVAKPSKLLAEPFDGPPRLPMRAQRPQAGERRRDRERDEQRRQRRDDDDDRELGEIAADLALNERDREEHDDVDERDDDGGRADLFAPVDRGIFGRLASAP